MASSRKLIGVTIADRYCITGEIGVGGMGRVYSAISFDDPAQTVAIKLILPERRIGDEELLRFQKEAALMSRLHHPHIISFYELGLFSQDKKGRLPTGGYYIVMEVARGQDLKSLLAAGRQDLDFFFTLGLQVASALEYTHAKHIIHRDIKPQNIIVDQDAEQTGKPHVKVLDFGVARLAEMDANLLDYGSEAVAGTPLYMAPETTRYLDAPNDHRMDLYALGCVLYESLVGRPPFSGSTREQLAREHAFTEVEPLFHLIPDIPPAVNDVILKLLSKDPQKRYQSAFGLIVDLERIQATLEGGQTSSSLGLYDHLRLSSLSMPLVGRDKPFDELIQNYDAVAKGRGRSRLSVVPAEAGMGKSKLLREFRAYLLKHRIRSVQVSFSRHENNLPFNALANGFNDYLFRVLHNDITEASEIKRKLKASLGETAEVLTPVLAGLRPYVYEETTEDENLDSRYFAADSLFSIDFNSFAKAFSDFTRCLADEAEPIVFLFDDMHWADKKSINLIDKFFSYNNHQRFYLVVSYRPSVLETNPEFDDFLKKFKKLKRRFSQLVLEPLDKFQVSDLISYSLNDEAISDDGLSKYLAQTGRGNPLYALEVLRYLISQRLVFFDESKQVWSYDRLELKRASIGIKSIDLVLTEIMKLNIEDRSVLEVAAIIGTNFYFDMLLVQKHVQALSVMNALQRAMELGLIQRSSDEKGYEQLGKSYRFTHSRIREAILDEIRLEKKQFLHRLVALKLESLISNSETQSLFTLAHHFNQAIGESFSQLATDLRYLAESALQYNVDAGERAHQIGALVTAERYFRNAYRITESLGRGQKVDSLQRQILDSLGDILGVERQYRQAILFYNQLLAFGLDKEDFARVSYKMCYFNMLNGRASSTYRNLEKILFKLSMPPLRPSPMLYFWSIRILLSSIFFGRKSAVFKKFRSVLEAVFDKRAKAEVEFHPVKFYHLAQSISLSFDLRAAFYNHSLALKWCWQGKATVDAVIRTLADHAFLLGLLGFKKITYRLLDQLLESSEHLKLNQISGYLIFQRTLILDYKYNKFENYQDNLRKAVELVTYDQNQQLLVQVTLFQMFNALCQCNKQQMSRLASRIPEQLRTRHWLSPRGVAIYCYGLLLQDSRAHVMELSSYLSRRHEVGARNSDAFIRVIECIVHLAAGKKDQARASYGDFLLAMKEKKEGFLYAYENDFLNLFLFTYPELFYYEFRRQVFSSSIILSRFRAHVRAARRVKFSRALSLMVRARSEELYQSKKVKERYDDALRSAVLSKNKLVEFWVTFWFARYLLRLKVTKRKDYLLGLVDQSKDCGFKLMSNLAIQVLDEFKIPYNFDSSEAGEAENELKVDLSPLQISLNQRLLPLMSEALDFRQSFEELMSILKAHYVFKAVHFVSLAEQDELGDLFLTTGIDESIGADNLCHYLSAYSSIRSSLFLPVGDAPWVSQSSNYSKILPGSERSRSSSVKEVDLDLTLDLKSSSAEKEPSGSHMNLLAPVRFSQVNLGLLFIENFQLEAKESMQARKDMDEFCAKLGLAWQHVVDLDSTRVRAPAFISGHHFLEPCSWLDLWTLGSLRGDREAVSFLGLNLNEDAYLVCYFRLNGMEQIRSELAANLWYNLFSLRSLSCMYAKKSWNVDEIYEVLVGVLFSGSKYRRLENIAFGFSIFDRANHSCLSGHVGPSRPLLLGQRNIVTPQNDLIATLESGRAIRFWKVAAAMNQPSLYILTHDSSKVESLPIDRIITDDFIGASMAEKQEIMRDHMRRHLLESHIPRYYLMGLIKVADLSSPRVAS